MHNLINLTIDGNEVTVSEGTTILQAAESLGIDIPTICYHEACSANALCRMCVVEVEGWRVLAASCVVQVSPGMVVFTNSPRVIHSRRTILEMLAASVDLSEAPAIQAMIVQHSASLDRFPEAVRRDPPLIDDNPMYVRDYAKCVLCWRCVQVCADDAQYTYAINLSGRGFETLVGTFYEKSIPQTTCVFCGQCIGVCPTNALKPKREWLMENGQSIEEIVKVTRSGSRQSKAV